MDDNVYVYIERKVREIFMHAEYTSFAKNLTVCTMIPHRKIYIVNRKCG